MTIRTRRAVLAPANAFCLDGELQGEVCKLDTYVTGMFWFQPMGKQDADTFVVCCSDGTLRWWNFQTGALDIVAAEGGPDCPRRTARCAIFYSESRWVRRRRAACGVAATATHHLEKIMN